MRCRGLPDRRCRGLPDSVLGCERLIHTGDAMPAASTCHSELLMCGMQHTQPSFTFISSSRPSVLKDLVFLCSACSDLRFEFCVANAFSTVSTVSTVLQVFFCLLVAVCSRHVCAVGLSINFYKTFNSQQAGNMSEGEHTVAPQRWFGCGHSCSLF